MVLRTQCSFDKKPLEGLRQICHTISLECSSPNMHCCYRFCLKLGRQRGITPNLTLEFCLGNETMGNRKVNRNRGYLACYMRNLMLIRMAISQKNCQQPFNLDLQEQQKDVILWLTPENKGRDVPKGVNVNFFILSSNQLGSVSDPLRGPRSGTKRYGSCINRTEDYGLSSVGWLSHGTPLDLFAPHQDAIF